MIRVNQVDTDTLSRLPRFANLSRAKLGRLTTAISAWRFHRRERIYAQGETARSLYILLQGVAKLSGYNKDRQLALMALIPPGEVFGIAALTLDPIHQFQCDAFTECVAARIDPQQFVDAMLGVPLIDFQTVLAMVASRSREIIARYSAMLRLPVRDRLLTAFAELSAKLGTKHERGTLLNIPLTHQDLADLIGATRPIITLQLKGLEHEGAVIRERHRLILVPEKLANQGTIDPPPAVFLPSSPVEMSEALLSSE